MKRIETLTCILQDFQEIEFHGEQLPDFLHSLKSIKDFEKIKVVRLIFYLIYCLLLYYMYLYFELIWFILKNTQCWRIGKSLLRINTTSYKLMSKIEEAVYQALGHLRKLVKKIQS